MHSPHRKGCLDSLTPHQESLAAPANMSWRNQGITGSNNIPLGTRRRFGGGDDDGGYNPSAPAEGLSELKRGRSPERSKSIPTRTYDAL